MTGVKGAKETSYRKGNVNLSAVDIGAIDADSAQGQWVENTYNKTAGSASRPVYFDNGVPTPIGNALRLTDGITAANVITLHDDGDDTNNGSELVICGNGNAFIGAGESPFVLHSKYKTDGASVGVEYYGQKAENFYMISDSAMYFMTNANNIANRVGALLDSAASFRPLIPGTGSLGNTSDHWGKAFIDQIVGTLDGGVRVQYRYNGSEASCTENGFYFVNYSSDSTSAQWGWLPSDVIPEKATSGWIFTFTQDPPEVSSRISRQFFMPFPRSLATDVYVRTYGSEVENTWSDWQELGSGGAGMSVQYKLNATEEDCNETGVYFINYETGNTNGNWLPFANNLGWVITLDIDVSSNSSRKQMYIPYGNNALMYNRFRSDTGAWSSWNMPYGNLEQEAVTDDKHYPLLFSRADNGNRGTLLTIAGKNVDLYYNPGTKNLYVHGVGRSGFIAYPKDGFDRSSNASFQGYLSIRLPRDIQDTMIKFYVDIYSYSKDTSVTYIIGGYVYTSVATKADRRWYCTSVQCLGRLDSPLANLPVKFGIDTDGWFWVTIGNANTAWSYPFVNIHSISYGGEAWGQYEVLNHDWNMAIGPTASGGITYTQESNDYSVRTGSDNVLGYYSRKWLSTDNTLSMSLLNDAKSATDIRLMPVWYTDPTHGHSIAFATHTEIRRWLDGVGAQSDGNYNGLLHPNGDDQGWLRTTKLGFIPYDQSTVTHLGTSAWRFLDSWIERMQTLTVFIGDAGTTVISTLSTNGAKFELREVSGAPVDRLCYQYFTGYAALRSDSDAFCDLGWSSKRFRNIYASNGTIQTSDRTKKKDIHPLSEQLTYNFIMGINAVSYKMIDGTSGRTHYGIIAQDIKELMERLGMDSKDFAGFIKSPRTREVQVPIEVEAEEDVDVVDENGKHHMEKQLVKKKDTRTELEPIPGEYDYGLRYEEFIAPIICVEQIHDRRLDEQAKTIADQQRQIEELRAENKSMKKRLARIEAAILA